MIYAEDILKKDRDQQEPKKVSIVTQGTAAGALIGLIAGALYAYFRKKPYVSSIIVGTLAGGIVSRISLIKK